MQGGVGKSEQSSPDGETKRKKGKSFQIALTLRGHHLQEACPDTPMQAPALSFLFYRTTLARDF